MKIKDLDVTDQNIQDFLNEDGDIVKQVQLRKHITLIPQLIEIAIHAEIVADGHTSLTMRESMQNLKKAIKQLRDRIDE